MASTNAGKSALQGKLVVMTGGSGFFGTHIAQALLECGARLRIASRHPEKALKLKPLANLGQLQFARCDVTKPASVAAVMHGADAVIIRRIHYRGAACRRDGDRDAVLAEGMLPAGRQGDGVPGAGILVKGISAAASGQSQE